MKRPLLLRLLPDRLRLAAFARRLRPPSNRWAQLYQGAPLRFARQVTMQLAPGDLVSDGIAFTGIHELGLSRRLIRLARRGGTMIDVGANLGYFTLLWVASNPGNRCLAIEPAPRNLPLLRANVDRNGFASRVTILGAAAGKEAGALPFDPGPSDQTGWGGLAPQAGGGTIQVEVVCLDHVAMALGRISLLKVDAEGADTWVLRGCDRLLGERRIGEVWFEQNQPRMRLLHIADGEAHEYLRSVGYHAEPVGDPRAEVVQWTARAAP